MSDAPAWDEHTVQIAGVEFPTYQIEDVDDAVVFAIVVENIEAFKPVPQGSVVVETPDETFYGSVDMVAIEHGQLTIRVEREHEDIETLLDDPDFEEYPMPDLDGLERMPAEEFHNDCDCLERDTDD